MVSRFMLLCVGFAIAQGVAFGQAPAPSVTYATGDEVNALRSDLEKRIVALEEAQAKMLRLGHSQALAIEQIAARDESGDYHWRFNGNSQSARQEFSRAIESTIPELGSFVVSNKTNFDTWITVNGDKYLVSAGKDRTLQFPPGVVVTQMPGEQPRNWYLEQANKYYQGVDIKLKPVTTYVYESPITYINPGGWVAAY